VPHFKDADFSEKSVIGRGGEGAVYKTIHSEYRFVVTETVNSVFSTVALKTLYKPVKFTSDLNEIKLLVEVSSSFTGQTYLNVQLRHSHIVQLLGILISDSSVGECYGYVMEYVQFGCLFDCSF